MDPFTILGVSSGATDDEIRTSYRKLVKLYHPDRNPNADPSQISMINWAYETLSDPVKRARYYQPFSVTQTDSYQEEDPAEIYKREFKRKRWEREKREREEKIAHQTNVMRTMRFVNIPIFMLAILLSIDRLLPAMSYEERMLESSREYRDDRKTIRTGTYLRTENFNLHFSSDLHREFDSFTTDTVMVNISVTPIFKVPRYASYFYDNTTRSGNVEKTIHGSWFLVLTTIVYCVASFVQRAHSSTAYTISFLPSICFILFLLSNMID